MNLIIFDLDGTLVDSLTDVVNCVNQVASKNGLPPFSPADVQEHFGRGPMKLWMGLLERSKTPYLLEGLVAQYRELYQARSLENTELYVGVRRMLKNLSSWKKVILSNKTQPLVEKIVGQLGIAEQFDAIFGAEAFYARKPSPVPILKIAERWKVSPSEIYVVGDSEIDLEAATLAGAKTILAEYGYGNWQKIKEFKIQFRAKSPEEIEKFFLSLENPKRGNHESIINHPRQSISP